MHTPMTVPSFNGQPLERYTLIKKESIWYEHNIGAWIQDYARDDAGEWVQFPLCSGGHYANTSLIEVSNHDHMKTTYPDIVVSATGGYESFAIFLKVSDFHLFEEEIDSLEHYPILNDDLHSQLEDDARREDWDRYQRGEFIEAVTAHLESIDSDTLRYAFERLLYDAGGEWYNESSDTMVVSDTDRVVDALLEGLK